ncbi:hypothetical protein CSUI_011519, partial [Cystoisospora suis]
DSPSLGSPTRRRADRGRCSRCGFNYTRSASDQGWSVCTAGGKGRRSHPFLTGGISILCAIFSLF